MLPVLRLIFSKLNLLFPLGCDRFVLVLPRPFGDSAVFSAPGGRITRILASADQRTLFQSVVDTALPNSRSAPSPQPGCQPCTHTSSLNVFFTQYPHRSTAVNTSLDPLAVPSLLCLWVPFRSLCRGHFPDDPRLRFFSTQPIPAWRPQNFNPWFPNGNAILSVVVEIRLVFVPSSFLVLEHT